MLNNQEPSLPILIQDLGRKFPTLKSKQKSRFGLYKCNCGNEWETTIQSVKRGKSKSCGCHMVNMVSKHKMSYTKLYKTWTNIKQRVGNKNRPCFKDYGGRGITICEDWKNSFNDFYNWAIANGYQDGLTIDRIDNDGNYEPSNCRWTTKTVQARNTRVLNACNTSGFRGVSFSIREKKWRANININNKQFYIGCFSTAIEAAKAYDNYVMANNLEHNINNIGQHKDVLKAIAKKLFDRFIEEELH